VLAALLRPAILVSLRSIGPRSSTNLSYLILVSTIRVRVQTWPSSRPVPHSLNLLVRKLLLPKLYASVPVTIGFTAPALAVYYTMYDGMCRIVTELSSEKRANRVFFGVPVPHSCETLLGAHVVSVCVSCCKCDGTEPHLDAPSACVLAVWADR